MFNEPEDTIQDVTAVITAMTDGERPFLYETLQAILSDSVVGQAILCIEKSNSWLKETIGSLATDPRLEVYRLDMAPLPIIRNQSIEPVKLPWIAYCDGDDVWCKGKTLRQRAYAEKTNSDFVGADHVLIDEIGKTRAFALARNIPMPSSWIVKTEIMRKYQFNPSAIIGSDGEWWVRTEGCFKKTRYPEFLIRYRVRSGSNSSSTASKRRKTKIVSISNIPVVGQGIFLATWLAWLLTRQNNYVWLSAWGKQPSTEAD